MLAPACLIPLVPIRFLSIKILSCREYFEVLVEGWKFNKECEISQNLNRRAFMDLFEEV